MAANDEDTRGLNEVDSDSNHEVSDNSDNKINPDYASMAARTVANIKRLQENVLSVSISTSSSFNNVSTVSVGQTSPSPIQSHEALGNALGNALAENCQNLPSS